VREQRQEPGILCVRRESRVVSYSVFQHWDPLRICVVGRSYPPEFYQWIQVPRVRALFEKIAMETEEDFQNIIRTLNSFGVQVLRPSCDDYARNADGGWHPPPMTPRDSMVMIGDQFYVPPMDWPRFYRQIKDPSWQHYDTLHQFLSQAPDWQVQEAYDLHGLAQHQSCWDQRYQAVLDHVRRQGNSVIDRASSVINGAQVSRIGRDLYFSTESYDQDIAVLTQQVNTEFAHTRNHVVNTGGHGDGTYCPVCPGLIISLEDVDTYADTFPGWEVVYLPDQSWDQVTPFLDLKKKNAGKWWIPGFEYDTAVIDVVEVWLKTWVGFVEETVFDVNMLIVDPHNVLVFNHNDRVFRALERFGITPHVVPFRHRYFWDGGIHCVTLDLARDGVMQDFFPERTC